MTGIQITTNLGNNKKFIIVMRENIDYIFLDIVRINPEEMPFFFCKKLIIFNIVVEFLYNKGENRQSFNIQRA